MSGSAVDRKPTGRPRKKGSADAAARRALLFENDADMSHLEKSAKHQAAARKSHEARGIKAPVPTYVGKVHPTQARAIAQRALTQHEQNIASGRRTLSHAIPEASQFLRKLVAGEIEGATVENRVQAAKIILTAGKIIGESSSKQRDGNDPADMSADELRAFIRAGMEQLAAMERDPIDVTPDSDRIMNPVALPDGSGS